MASLGLENKGKLIFVTLLWLHLQDPKGPFWISSLLPDCCYADNTPGMALANHCQEMPRGRMGDFALLLCLCGGML